MKSLSTIEQANNDSFLNALRTFDPELYMIKVALEETRVNPLIIPKIIRVIGNLILGTGYGKVQIFMQSRIITQIKPEESVELNEKAGIE